MNGSDRRGARRTRFRNHVGIQMINPLLESISNESATIGSSFEFDTSLILFSSTRTNRYYIFAISSSPPFVPVCARLFAHTHIFIRVSLRPIRAHNLVFFFNFSSFSPVLCTLFCHRCFPFSPSIYRTF